ncbi:exonuclease SbcCD subunit D [uncultured Gemmiger sp.]|uniref:exonuclease SbcCD subunit D n=1 Tax=uncultured Gemmiger sp. TaxID=1623490 RepID=UPI0025E3F2F4|nr:exonuclease SbcCD subunit D [uncultured Gemmiger sp.]
MRFLHLADLHLGKRVNGFDLLEDQRAILEQILALCGQHRVQAVVLAGDIYDVPQPPAAAVLLLDWFLTELAQRGIAVLAISGNHDSAERLDYAGRLLAKQGVYLAGRFTGSLAPVRLADEYGPVEFVLLPFVRAATVRHFLPGADIRSYGDAVAAALATLPPADGVRRVLAAHQFVTAASRPPETAGSESCALEVGTVEQVDAACLAGFCYVALGHIHRPQQVGSPTVRYAGSPLCYSLDECGAEKSCPLVTLDADGHAAVKLLPLVPRRAMRHLTGPLDRLTNPANVCDAGDYIWATLTDETPQPDAMVRLRAAYPNAMKLDYAPRSGAPADAALTAAAVRRRSFEELFADFFETVQGRAPTKAEQQALDTLREEVGPCGR